MTASVLKQIPQKSKYTKRSKERYLLGQKHNLLIFGVIPFLSYKMALKQQLNDKKTGPLSLLV